MAEKIPLDPDISPREIMERYGVSRATAFRSKKRGYVTQNYHKNLGGPRARSSTQRRFMEIIRLKSLNLAGFESMEKHRFYDLKKGEARLFSAEWQDFRREIGRVRKKLERFLEEPTKNRLAKIIDEQRIHQHLLFSNKKMLYRMLKDMRVYEEELEAAKQEVRKFLKQLKV